MKKNRYGNIEDNALMILASGTGVTRGFSCNGGNIKQLQEILGHTNLRIVELYLKLADIDLEKARSYSPLDNLR